MKSTQSCGLFIFKAIVISVFFISLIVNQGQAKMAGDIQSAQPEFAIAGSQVLKINSAITGQEYVLHISLPQQYGDTTKIFPVVYLLDSQWDFPLVTAIYGDQYYDGFMPNTIIVGITWGGENPNYDTRRAFDLSPTDAGQPARYGNAEKFLSFIKKEAIPFVDLKYRTDKNNRTLAGHSFGGLFTLYALFTEPDLFNHYIPGSPAHEWDNSSIKKCMDKFSKVNLSHPVKVYMYMGEYEDLNNGFGKLTKAITDCKVKGLEIKTQVIKGSGHSGTKPEGYNRALQYVFERPSLNLDKKILSQYAGEYAADANTVFKVKVDKSNLVIQTPDNFTVRVHAASENEFYVKGAFMNGSFAKDENGKVTGMNVQTYGASFFAKKIK
ncbi:MAG: alpha/beta hydrolase [Bacteroidetes bacterium]|nr:alpha/beta hydrolase [Bacteroidota bacterium]